MYLQVSISLDVGRCYLYIQLTAQMTAFSRYRKPPGGLWNSSICCFLGLVAQSFPRWTKWPASMARHRACHREEGNLDKSVKKQQPETALPSQWHLFSFPDSGHVRVPGKQHSAMTWQFPDIICAPASAEAAENTACVRLAGLTEIRGREISYWKRRFL